MAYIKPDDVTSPKKNWSLVETIIDEGEGPEKGAYAIGTWDNERRIGFRWNGEGESPIGNPQSRGLPIWTMLDRKLHGAVVALAPPRRRAWIADYLGFPASVELRVSYHASGNLTLTEKSEGETMKDVRTQSGKLIANGSAGEFYRAVAHEIADRQAIGQKVAYIDTSLDRKGHSSQRAVLSC